MPRSHLVTLLLRWAINALGIFVAASIIPGISYRDPTSLGIVVVVLGLLNAFLKPLLVLFALPFVVLTLGFGLLVINALLLLLASEVVPGFEVSGFWAAFFGALVVSAVNLLVGNLIGDRVTVVRRGPPPPRRHGPDDDVIDV
jgi:putative membrane protein